jgi:putative ABC transport system substrate-binding protein
MRRRDFLGVLSGAAAIWPGSTHAQRLQRIPRIGVLWHAGSAEEEGSNFTELVKGFVDLGYVDGRNIKLEHRFPNEMPDRFRSMAAELVALNIDALISVGANAAPYAKDATTSIPVIFIAVSDPIGTGLVKSISRPEGNVTGISNSAADLIGKRVEIFKELVPDLSRIALLINANAKVAPIYVEAIKSAAARLNLSSDIFPWRSPEELDSVFGSIKRAGANGVIIAPDGLAFTHSATIARLAVAQGLPLSGWSIQTLESGALMSYGADPDEIYRRAAVYVDKILKGRKPSDLPVEGPSKFQFGLNRRTAKALGLPLSPALIARANEVIE